MTLRKHQAETLSHLEAAADTGGFRRLYVLATPGGGKSSIPIIAAKSLIPVIADRICVVVPRSALQEQGERGFLDPFFRSLLGHSRTIRSATNESDPCRGHDGFVTTYQALGLPQSEAVREDFRQHRYILVLDECHHVAEDSEWHKALQEMQELAAFTIFMSGTLERSDGKRIAFIPYRKGEPAPERDAEARVVRYSRSDALREAAILPLRFHLFDAATAWRREGETKTVSSFRQVKAKDRSAALFCALNTGFASSITEACVQHWRAWKTDVQPSSRLLVVCAGLEGARESVTTLSRLGIPCEIATSHDSKEAQDAIRRFRNGRTPCLVTIAMAYEGLDVPAATHVLCLTRIRSKPWIEQMVARVVRIDPEGPPYSMQLAHVFAPDDPALREIVTKIEAEQAAIPRKNPFGEGGKEKKPVPSFSGYTSQPFPDLTVLAGEISGFRAQDVTGKTFAPEPAASQDIETPSMAEARIRREIHDHVNAYCHRYAYDIPDIHREIKASFGGKARQDMNLGELWSVMAHLKDLYPLKGEPSRHVPGLSQPRKIFANAAARDRKVEIVSGW